MRVPSDPFRLTQDLKRELSELSFSGPIAGAAFRTALASILSMLAAMMLHLDKPYWAAITAVSIVLPDIASSLARSVDRCVGTVAGAVVGYLGAHFVADHLVFQLIIASVGRLRRLWDGAQRARLRGSARRGHSRARHVWRLADAGRRAQPFGLPLIGNHGGRRGVLPRGARPRSASRAAIRFNRSPESSTPR